MVVIASAHSTAPSAFNAVFYATVATIIPVLYLALVVQGGGIDALLKEALDDFKRVWAIIPALRQGLMRRAAEPQTPTAILVIAVVLFPIMGLITVAFAAVMTIVACLIAFAGSVSELCALYALYKQDAFIRIPGSYFGPNPISINIGYIVGAGAGILILATTILPFAQLIGRVRAGKDELPSRPPAEEKPAADE
jgi:hypothetical protein